MLFTAIFKDGRVRNIDCLSQDHSNYIANALDYCTCTKPSIWTFATFHEQLLHHMVTPALDITILLLTHDDVIKLKHFRVTGHLYAQRPATRSFDVFFDLGRNRLLSKQSWGWWFENPSHPLWRHHWKKSLTKAVQLLYGVHFTPRNVHLIND